MKIESAQDQQNRMLSQPRKLNTQLMKDLIAKNDQLSSSGDSSSPKDLIEQVMQRHGVTANRAKELVE